MIYRCVPFIVFVLIECAQRSRWCWDFFEADSFRRWQRHIWLAVTPIHTQQDGAMGVWECEAVALSEPFVETILQPQTQ